MTRRHRPSVPDAITETERDRWKCRTCSAPAAEDSEHCEACARYWADVDAGLYVAPGDEA